MSIILPERSERDFYVTLGECLRCEGSGDDLDVEGYRTGHTCPDCGGVGGVPADPIDMDDLEEMMGPFPW